MIASKAKSGDFVYIHYSGHGVKLPDSLGYSKHNRPDVELVLFDSSQGIRYFLGLELTRYLNGMVKKGLDAYLNLEISLRRDVLIL